MLAKNKKKYLLNQNSYESYIFLNYCKFVHFEQQNYAFTWQSYVVLKTMQYCAKRGKVTVMRGVQKVLLGVQENQQISEV